MATRFVFHAVGGRTQRSNNRTRPHNRTKEALLRVAFFAPAHPLLCLSMPHRYFPVPKVGWLCIRCGCYR